MNIGKLFKQKSFQVVFYTISSVILILFIILLYTFNTFRDSIEDRTYKYIESKSREYANWVKLKIEKPLHISRALADMVIAFKRKGVTDRALVGEIIKRVLENNPEYLSVWITFERNGFDGMDEMYKDTLYSNEVGRFEPCFYRVGNRIESSVTSEADATTSDYFNIPKTTLQETIIEPYYYSYTEREDDKIFMTSTVVPIIYNGVFIGVAGVDISMDALQQENNRLKIFENGFGKLISSNGNVVCHPQTSQIGKLSPELKEKNGDKILDAIKNGKFLSIDDFSIRLKKESRKVFVPIRFGNCPNAWSYALVVPKEDIMNEVNSSIRTAILFSIGGTLVLIVLLIFLLKPIISYFKKITEILRTLAKGETNLKIDFVSDKNYESEFGQIALALNELQKGLKEKADFARKIGSGNLSVDFKPLSDKDEMGFALLEMRDSLLKAAEEEEIRKKEDEQRNWATQGIAKFAEILRKNNNDIEKLSYEIIKELVKYMNMNQGGLFVLNDDDKQHPYLELKACYAYNRQKYVERRIEIGEGLVGTCFQEGETIYLTEVPKNYVYITSGLGEATPTCILIVPLKVNDEIYGIIELASFEKLEKYQIEFVEKVAESIASTLSSVKINLRTAMLLERSQQQAEEMRAQEEEMRQNMEELQATQEEMARKNAEIQSIMEGINISMPYIEFDQSEHIININDIFTQITGLTLNEIKGAMHRNFVSQDYIQSGKYFELWSKLKMGIPVTEEFEHNIKGRTIVARETFVPIKDKEGNLIKVMMFFMDLTEQKRLEKEIKEKLEQSKEMEEEMRQNLEELQATQEQIMKMANEQKEKDEAIKRQYEKEMQELRLILQKQREESEKELKNKIKEREQEILNQQKEILENYEKLKKAQELIEKKANEEKRMKELMKQKNKELEDLKESLMEEAKAQKEMLLSKIDYLEKELEKAREEIKRLKEN